jgi:2-polyprenyl-3-methyl-5-hydroxy-6-metoxy-1,4-benzoquinol methylase
MSDHSQNNLQNTESADSENARFWNYLCGTSAATYMGFDLSTKKGITDFDSWYMEFYPYLLTYIDWATHNAKSCLEVGIGLGTVSRYLARNIGEFTALDVAREPCIFLKNSLEAENTTLKTINGSILDGPISTADGEKFDVAIAIGSLHHTGNIHLALDNLINSVKPGGRILVMVYNEFSVYRFIRNPLKFLLHLSSTGLRRRYSWNEADKSIRAMNDSNEIGEAAPHTAYSSRRLFKSQKNSRWKVKSENISNVMIFKKHVKRENLLPFVKIKGGLDLYALGIRSSEVYK